MAVADVARHARRPRPGRGPRPERSALRSAGRGRRRGVRGTVEHRRHGAGSDRRAVGVRQRRCGSGLGKTMGGCGRRQPGTRLPLADRGFGLDWNFSAQCLGFVEIAEWTRCGASAARRTGARPAGLRGPHGSGLLRIRASPRRRGRVPGPSSRWDGHRPQRPGLGRLRRADAWSGQLSGPRPATARRRVGTAEPADVRPRGRRHRRPAQLGPDGSPGRYRAADGRRRHGARVGRLAGARAAVRHRTRRVSSRPCSRGIWTWNAGCRLPASTSRLWRSAATTSVRRRCRSGR